MNALQKGSISKIDPQEVEECVSNFTLLIFLLLLLYIIIIRAGESNFALVRQKVSGCQRPCKPFC